MAEEAGKAEGAEGAEEAEGAEGAGEVGEVGKRVEHLHRLGINSPRAQALRPYQQKSSEDDW
ncbi:hypothetical protein, partial [Lyngbya sp. CCY1209]|uniref:hypothetical protein n=1 Tax=Lyngbya sp. CCY1209 TaxID=2886103 RepID=UPI002D1FD529